jgi:hypothetical protein
VILLETWRWEFYAFQSKAEGCPVQMWFDGLPQDHRDEITDLLDYVRNTTGRPWPDKVYDPLEGAGGISEIKVENIPYERDGKLVEVTYRIYGFFGPKERKHTYTFLHAWEKDAKNDRLGKKIAKGRLDELSRRGSNVGVRKFDFEGKSDPQAQTRPRRPS